MDADNGKLSVISRTCTSEKIQEWGIHVAFDIHEVLERKGIHVPDHHKEMLTGQMAGFEELRKTVNQEQLKDLDMALTHIPGGEQK